MGLDSYSMRLTLNREWVGPGERRDAERAGEASSEDRLLADNGLGDVPPEAGTGATGKTTLAWGRNKRERTVLSVDPTAVLTHNHWTGSSPGVVIAPVMVQNAFLAESAFRFADVHGVFARLEWVEKMSSTTCKKLNLGYSFDFVRSKWLGLGAGLAGSFHCLPKKLDAAYGGAPTSLYGFVRARLR